MNKDKVNVLLELVKESSGSELGEITHYLVIIALWYHFENHIMAVLVLFLFVLGASLRGSECNKYTKMIEAELDKEE